MKKQILTLMVAAISITGFAQVGVGTENPQNALHIVGDGVRIENTAETSHYVLPAADGTAGQVLTTDGASAVTWAAAGAASPSVRDNVTSETLFAADLNGYVIVTISPPNPLDLSTISASAAAGDTITLVAFAGFIVTGVRAGSDTAPNALGAGITYLYTGTDWVSTRAN
jgi:hypothetical protein